MSKSQRDSFVFYRSFQDAINELSEVDQLIIYRSIATYSLYREEPELEGVTKVVWLLIRPQLDANWKKFDKGCKGGAPEGNTNAVKTTTKQPKTTINQPQNNLKQPNDNINDNDNIRESDNNIIGFIKPTLSDIEGYITKSRLSVSAESFYDYYASNGWMIGNRPMADWRATLRNWNRKSQLLNSNQPRAVTADL